MSNEETGPGDNLNRYYEKAAHFVNSGRSDLAIQILSEGLSHFPDDLNLLYLMSHSQRQAGQTAAAQRTVDQLLAMDPHHSYGLRIAAALAMDKGHFFEAEKFLLTRLQEHPEDSIHLRMYGHLMLRALQLKKSEQLLRWSLSVDPEDTLCQSLLAMVLAYRMKHGESQTAGIRSLELDPEDPNSHQGMAQAFMRGGNPFRARHHFRESLRLAPDNTAFRKNWLAADINCRWMYLPKYYWNLVRARIPGGSYTVWGLVLSFWLGSAFFSVPEKIGVSVVMGYAGFVVYTYAVDLLAPLWIKMVPPK